MDPTPSSNQAPKRPVVGHKMRAAHLLVSRQPGTADAVLDREFGRGMTDKLINAGMLGYKMDESGQFRLLHALSRPKEDLEPDPTYSILPATEARTIQDRLAVINHNALLIACPICESPRGIQCRSTKSGNIVNWPHRARIENIVFLLAHIISEHTSNPQ